MLSLLPSKQFWLLSSIILVSVSPMTFYIRQERKNRIDGGNKLNPKYQQFHICLFLPLPGEFKGCGEGSKYKRNTKGL